jgi:D-aspartate ligase
MKIIKRNFDRPYAIVFGLDSMQGIQAARILADKQVPVIAIVTDPKHHACRTRVCEEILVANQGDEETIHLLEALGAQLNQKAVLFPCTDSKVLLVSRNRQKLEQWYHVSLPHTDVVEMLSDKIGFYTYAQEVGFPIPVTRILHNRREAEEAAENMIFPCALKPSRRSPAWSAHTKLKAFKVLNSQELLKLFDEHEGLAEALIVQEWIEGTDAELYSCNCYFNAVSEPIVTFVARKLRQWPPKTGQSSLGEECRNDLVLQESIRLFRSVNYRGLGYVEMKRDINTGKYYIVEPNIGRPTGRSAIAEAGGIPLLYTMYCDEVGLPLPTDLEQKYEGVKWIHLRRDFQAALLEWRRGNLTIKEWWRSIRGPKAYALFSWNDPIPFISDIVDVTHLLLSPHERKKRGL